MLGAVEGKEAEMAHDLAAGLGRVLPEEGKLGKMLVDEGAQEAPLVGQVGGALLDAALEFFAGLADGCAHGVEGCRQAAQFILALDRNLAIVVLAADFGGGKSHVLEYLSHKARQENFAVSKVVISKETQLFDPLKGEFVSAS